MTRPEPIGRVESSKPMGVAIRPTPTTIQDAVSATLAIHTNSRAETDTLLSGWPEIMTAVDNKVTEILSRQNVPVEE